MVRRVNSQELRERQRMRSSSDRKGGEWCVVGFCDDWEDEFGLQGWNYKSEEVAQEVADELDKDEEFQHVDEHRVMTHDDYEELCEDRGVDKQFYW